MILIDDNHGFHDIGGIGDVDDVDDIDCIDDIDGIEYIDDMDDVEFLCVYGAPHREVPPCNGAHQWTKSLLKHLKLDHCQLLEPKM